MKAVIELDHSEKWAAAIRFPSRPDSPMFLLPGQQCFFYAAQSKQKHKGRRSQSTPGNWHGPAVVIGTEWDQGQQKESYWIRYNGRCRLVPPQNIRHATMEESLSREAVIELIKASLDELGKESGRFSYDDNRSTLPVIPEDPKAEAQEEEAQQPAVSLEEPPSTPLGEQPKVSIEEALKKFFAGEAASQFCGDLPKVTPWTQDSNRVLPDNLYGKDSRVPSPPREPTGVETPISDTLPGRDTPISDTTPAPPTPQNAPAPGLVGDMEADAGYHDVMYSDLTEREKQSVFWVQGYQHNQCLVVDYGKQECFFLKWKTTKANQRKRRELDPKYFNEQERKAFSLADAKEWKSFLETGAVTVLPPKEAKKIDPIQGLQATGTQGKDQ